MNAIVRPPAAPATEQDALDRMARNRASDRRPAMLGPVVVPNALEGRAFRVAALAEGVRLARDALAVADCRRRAVTGRVAKEKLRLPVNRARTRLRDAERALDAEMRGAESADAVMRTDQVQHGGRMDGVTLRQARVVVTAPGRVEQVTALGRLIRDKSLTRTQGAALVRYREAHEAAAAGLYGGGLNPDATGGGGSTGGNARIEHAVADGVLLAQMRAALFPRGMSLIEHVAIEGLTVASWAARQVTGREGSMNPARAMGLLEAAADLLVGVG